jgi:hypothetical protein
MFFDEALERAKYLDERLAKDGKPVGPLHGLPISIKVRPQSAASLITAESFGIGYFQHERKGCDRWIRRVHF